MHARTTVSQSLNPLNPKPRPGTMKGMGFGGSRVRVLGRSPTVLL